MPITLKNAAKISLAAAALAAAYMAGATGLPTNANKLDQAHAVLGSIQSRPAYGAIEAAKAKISGAQQDIQTAKTKVGG